MRFGGLCAVPHSQRGQDADPRGAAAWDVLVDGQLVQEQALQSV